MTDETNMTCEEMMHDDRLFLTFRDIYTSAVEAAKEASYRDRLTLLDIAKQANDWLTEERYGDEA